MRIIVTKAFLASVKNRKDLLSAFLIAADKAAHNPELIRKKRDLGDIYSLDLRGGARAVLAKDEMGNLVPCFIGTHKEYMRFLDSRPDISNLLSKTVKKKFNIACNINRAGKTMGFQSGSTAAMALCT